MLIFHRATWGTWRADATVERTEKPQATVPHIVVSRLFLQILTAPLVTPEGESLGSRLNTHTTLPTTIASFGFDLPRAVLQLEGYGFNIRQNPEI